MSRDASGSSRKAALANVAAAEQRWDAIIQLAVIKPRLPRDKLTSAGRRPPEASAAGHTKLLPATTSQFAVAVTIAQTAAELNDLEAAKLDDRVLVLAFSEFGRRLEENGSAGTDHGAAAPVFLAGPSTSGGVIGSHPSLIDLDQGDLKMAIDFRRVYATLLERWLHTDALLLLGSDFEQLTLLR